MRIAAGVALALACLAGTVAGQALYKWTDDQGRTHYSDRPPKDYKGPLTRIEREPPGPTPQSPAAAPGTPAPSREEAKPAGAAPAGAEAKEDARPPQDIAGKRRDTREKLRAEIDAAQARLDAARAELAAAAEPGPDDQQVIQQYPKGQPGMLQPSQRSNCVPVQGPDGKTYTRCAALVPNASYYERVTALEAKVKAAEEALEGAERAYRRGVD